MKAVILSLLVLAVFVSAETKIDWSGTWKATKLTAEDKCCYPAAGFTFTGKEITMAEMMAMQTGGALSSALGAGGLGGALGALGGALGGAGSGISIKVNSNPFGALGSAAGAAGALGGALSGLAGLSYQMASMLGKWDATDSCKKYELNGKDMNVTASGAAQDGKAGLTGFVPTLGNQGIAAFSINNYVSANKTIDLSFTFGAATAAIQCSATLVQNGGMSWIWWVVIILVILAILAVVGFLLYKRQQASKLSGNLGGHEYARA